MGLRDNEGRGDSKSGRDEGSVKHWKVVSSVSSACSKTARYMLIQKVLPARNASLTACASLPPPPLPQPQQCNAGYHVLGKYVLCCNNFGDEIARGKKKKKKNAADLFSLCTPSATATAQRVRLSGVTGSARGCTRTSALVPNWASTTWTQPKSASAQERPRPVEKYGSNIGRACMCGLGERERRGALSTFDVRVKADRRT